MTDDPIEAHFPQPPTTAEACAPHNPPHKPPVIQEPLRWEVWKLGDQCRVAAFARRVDACEYIDARHYAYTRLVEVVLIPK